MSNKTLKYIHQSVFTKLLALLQVRRLIKTYGLRLHNVAISHKINIHFMKILHFKLPCNDTYTCVQICSDSAFTFYGIVRTNLVSVLPLA